MNVQVMRNMKRPIIIGLTGSIGMGKSAVAKMFEAEGVAVFDADAAVHALQASGSPLLAAIETAFPDSTNETGVDRAALGAMVFGQKEKLAQLEAIIHPAVAAQREAFLATHKLADIVVFDIPLLFEKGGAEKVDKVVVVSAPAPIQRERVLARRGMTESKFESILKLQMPDAEKRKRADFVIDTGINLAQTVANISKLVKSLRLPLAPSQK